MKVEQSMLMGSTIQFKDPDMVEKFNRVHVNERRPR